MPPHIHIGVSDFQKLRREHGLYVDKTDFIIEVIKRKAEAQLYPRPRRFGKTLNMTTLHYFLERGPDRTELFSDLKVWQDAESMTHFQRHAVVFLSFKDVKPLRWAEARPKLGVVI
ncbi:MAG TPA: AAA family ATPase, partial [Myxococcota bacterium]|nr:AAA family ATPase [Myxococcota bacterium]